MITDAEEGKRGIFWIEENGGNIVEGICFFIEHVTVEGGALSEGKFLSEEKKEK